MDTYSSVFKHNTEFFSTYNPDMIEEALVNQLRKEKIEPTISKNKYKIKFTKTGKDDFDNKIADDIEIVVRILLVPGQQVCCIEFSKTKGRQTTFLKHFENYKNDENCLAFANDTMIDLEKA